MGRGKLLRQPRFLLSPLGAEGPRQHQGESGTEGVMKKTLTLSENHREGKVFTGKKWKQTAPLQIHIQIHTLPFSPCPLPCWAHCVRVCFLFEARSHLMPQRCAAWREQESFERLIRDEGGAASLCPHSHLGVPASPGTGEWGYPWDWEMKAKQSRQPQICTRTKLLRNSSLAMLNFFFFCLIDIALHPLIFEGHVYPTLFSAAILLLVTNCESHVLFQWNNRI